MARLVECVPNFSVSKEKDEAVFQGLVDVSKSVPNCMVIDVQSDGNHNRCVFTIVGDPDAIEEVAFRLTKQAMETIDMTKHQGQHPRMGATDAIPFIPTMDMTVEECVELSKRVAKRIWEELQVPSFLYEDSATSPDRVNLAKVRKGQFEGMPEKLLDPDWAPDFGERKIHPTAGIVAIGAGFLLIILLFYFIMVYYVKPIYRMSDGIDGYRLSGRRHVYEFDGDDQLANINSGVTEIVELKKRIKNFRDERERLLQNISDLSAE